MRGLVHHIDLTVSDLERSRAFYDVVLTFLGYTRKADHPTGTDWDWLGDGRTGAPFHSIGVVRYGGPGADAPHDRYAPGLHHLAWTARDRADVDALHALLVEAGAMVLDAPADYPRYGPDYYALFFADPDGLKLEFVAGRTES
jgi:catechol 2,3-dioxygenase-like lactoylglutathione lyase family enzyme